MDREGGYKERMRKFFLHFLILSSFPRSPAARLQRFVQPCDDDDYDDDEDIYYDYDDAADFGSLNNW